MKGSDCCCCGVGSIPGGLAKKSPFVVCVGGVQPLAQKLLNAAGAAPPPPPKKKEEKRKGIFIRLDDKWLI